MSHLVGMKIVLNGFRGGENVFRGVRIFALIAPASHSNLQVYNSVLSFSFYRAPPLQGEALVKFQLIEYCSAGLKDQE